MRRRHNADKKATDKEHEKEIDQDEHSSDVQDSALEDSDAKLGTYSNLIQKTHLLYTTLPTEFSVYFLPFHGTFII